MSSTLDLGALRGRLMARYAELGGDIARLEAEMDAPLDADFAEQANELEEMETREALESGKLAEQAAIRAALRRIAEGHYGICENCGAEIAPGRLAALPTAVRCIACAA
jgi:RNA polymerase-binding transcription factor DksA